MRAHRLVDIDVEEALRGDNLSQPPGDGKPGRLGSFPLASGLVAALGDLLVAVVAGHCKALARAWTWIELGRSVQVLVVELAEVGLSRRLA